MRETEECSSAHEPRVTIRVLLPSLHAGAIIGIKGSVAQTIEKTHSVKVQATSVIGRLTMISGSTRNVADAWKTSLTYLSNSYPETYTKNIAINFLLSSDLVSLLKEQLETNLNFEYMARTTGTQLRLKKGNLPRSTERIVQLVIPDINHLDAFEQCVFLLADVTRMNFHLSMSPETVYYIPENTSDDQFIKSMHDEYIYR